MNTQSQAYVKDLTQLFLFLLPESILGASRVTSILYDHRVIVIGLTMRSAEKPRARQELLAAQERVGRRLRRRVGVKLVTQGALVILPLRPTRSHVYVQAAHERE